MEIKVKALGNHKKLLTRLSLRSQLKCFINFPSIIHDWIDGRIVSELKLVIGLHFWKRPQSGWSTQLRRIVGTGLQTETVYVSIDILNRGLSS